MVRFGPFALVLSLASFFLLVFIGPERFHPGSDPWPDFIGDGSHMQLGLEFFIRSPWEFPPSRYADFPFPSGTSVGLTDSLPWAAFIWKLSPFLRAHSFLMFWSWLWLSFALMGALSFSLLRKITRDAWFSAVGSVFFILSSPVLFRFTQGHFALCSHWVVILSFLGYWEGACERKPLRGSALQLLATSIAAGVHPYLWIMTLGLSLLGWGYLRGFRARVMHFGLQGGISLGLLALFGYLGQTGAGSEDYRRWSADLLTFFNSRGNSLMLPPIRSAGTQYEGYAYLGLGGIFLFLFFIFFSGARKRFPEPAPWKFRSPHWIAFMVPLAFFVVSLSADPTIAGHGIFSFERTYFLKPFAMIFRAIGRMVWVPFYALWFLMLGFFHQSLSRKKAFILCVVLAGIQAIDLYPAWKTSTLREPSLLSSLRAPFWKDLGHRFDSIVLVPPQISQWQKNHCRGLAFSQEDVLRFGMLAVRERAHYNSSFLSRADEGLVDRQCGIAERQLSSSVLPAGILFVVHPSYFDRWGREPPPSCQSVDGYWVCGDEAGDLGRSLPLVD